MKYSNPKVKDGVNVSKGHPLGEFFKLLLGVAALIVIGGIVLALTIGWAVKFVPFGFETELASRFSQSQPKESPQQQALQELADRVVAEMDLPDDMTITAHFVAGETINAFATVGGHVVFFEGLIREMGDENSLAMVMAHEIAHVEHRHPIASLGRGIAVMLTILAVTGNSGADVPGGLVNNLGLFSAMTFSRDQEREADATALEALNRVYGHVGGAGTFFRKAAAMSGQSPPELLSTHPNPGDRVRNLRVQALEAGWTLDGTRSSLVPVLSSAELDNIDP